MLFKKIVLLLLALVMSMSLCFGCAPSAPKPTPEPEPEQPTTVPTVPVLTPQGRIVEPTHHMFDNFNFGGGGFTESEFYINQMRWGNNNNGVMGDSIGYTADGLAVLKAYGDFTDKEGYKRSGSCLLSNDYIGPGLIEVAMQVMPRLGGCTAIWPFYEGTNEDTGEYQYQEIDIEIPAGRDMFNAATFETVMNTNYAKTWKENGGGPMRTVKPETLTPANDGAWHKYSIQWETSPKARVRYYVDGVLTADTNDDKNGYKAVSDATAPLQIGVWFPDGWAGDRNFDEAYSLVDWVSYEPYTDQPRSESAFKWVGKYPTTQYPTKPMEIDKTNYISNGNFDSTSVTNYDGRTTYAWGADFKPELLTDSTGDNGKELALTAGKKVTQTISGVYGKTRSGDKNFGDNSYYYEFDLSGTVKAIGDSAATVTIEFLDSANKVIASGTKTFNVTTTSNLSLAAKSVDGTKAMRVSIATTKGTVNFDNIKLQLRQPIVA